jgi:ABC-type phosphate/phosphonate transport system substrate-binding protein
VIAHLGMYDVPKANAIFWSLVRARLGYGPQDLSQETDYWSVWQSPDLLFSQTCGYPYRAKLHGKVQLIGTPDYGLADCPPGYYCSVIVARADDPRNTLKEFDGADFAYNEPLSQSGWAAPVQHMLNKGIRPGKLHKSGAHAASLQMVAGGLADFAGIDAVTYNMLRTSDFMTHIKIIERTPPTPGLPFITGQQFDPKEIFTAVLAAIEDLEDHTRAALSLCGLCRIPAQAYLSVQTSPVPEVFLRS